MRPALRLAATASRTSQFLTANAPTGLTGVATHPTPRPALLYLYNKTLDRLKEFPASSVYRQSTEALTKARLKIVESQVPDGYEAWLQRSKKQLEDNPQVFSTIGGAQVLKAGGVEFVTRNIGQAEPSEEDEEGMIEGAQNPEDVVRQEKLLNQGRKLEDFHNVDVELETEPPLNVQQISEIETQIGAGLLEEIVLVAEGELQLASVMLENKVWEELEEKPVDGQWTYFQRDTHVRSDKTQAP